MAVDERRRHEMYLSLERAIGREGADTLMELVPPVGWADVATKKDLEALEERMNLRFQIVDERISRMEQTFLAVLSDRLRKQTVTLTSLFFGAAGVVIAAGRL